MGLGGPPCLRWGGTSIIFEGGGSRRSVAAAAACFGCVGAGVDGTGCASEEPFAASEKSHFPKLASNRDGQQKLVNDSDISTYRSQVQLL